MAFPGQAGEMGHRSQGALGAIPNRMEFAPLCAFGGVVSRYFQNVLRRGFWGGGGEADARELSVSSCDTLQRDLAGGRGPQRLEPALCSKNLTAS